MEYDPERASRLRALEDQLRALAQWDLTLETKILHELVGPIYSWPREWRTLVFAPTENVAHASALVEQVLPGWVWSISGPDSSRPCGVTERTPFRPIPTMRRGLFSPAANLVSSLLLALASQLDRSQESGTG